MPLLGGEIAPAHIAPFLVGVFAAPFVLTRLYDGTGGSVLLPMLMHATVNTVGANFVFGFAQGEDLMRLWWINAAVWSAVAVGVGWRMRRDHRDRGSDASRDRGQSVAMSRSS